MVQCEHVVKSYNGKRVIDDVTYNVNKGEVFALLGPNGAGKTTIIKIILGLIKSDSGTVKVNKEIKLGYSPETPYFHGFLNAREVLRFYWKLQNMHKDKLEEEISNVLKIVGLSESQDKKISAYSKGMVQRLAFAQALLESPDLLILDEPCAGLDAAGRKHMIGIINKLKATGKTIILNSHILADVEEVADRGIIMKHGKILAEITNENIKQHELEDIFIGLVGEEEYE